MKTQAQTTPDSLQMPLGQMPGGALQNKPWKLNDLTGLRAELPPLPNGAGPWLSAFQALTTGTVVAMGDIRSILAASVGIPALMAIEQTAGTADVEDGVPFTAAAFCAALRTHFPIRTAALAGFSQPWKEDGSNTPVAWLHRAVQTWVQPTGEQPGDGTPACVMLKEKLLNNVPPPVKTQILENPLLAGASWVQWSQRLTTLLQKKT